MIDPFLKPPPKKPTVHLNCGPGQDSHERFALQAEAESLRQTVEKIAMQVGGAWLQGSWQNGFQLVASGSHLYIYIICIWMVCVLNHFHLPLVAVINSQCTCVLKSPNPWLVHPSISTEHAMLTKSSMDWDADTDPTYVRCCETG